VIKDNKGESLGLGLGLGFDLLVLPSFLYFTNSNSNPNPNPNYNPVGIMFGVVLPLLVILRYPPLIPIALRLIFGKLSPSLSVSLSLFFLSLFSLSLSLFSLFSLSLSLYLSIYLSQGVFDTPQPTSNPRPFADK
jgi:hypothetical protein